MSLTAYIRYDHNGRIVPGGPIVTKNKPAVGNWQVVAEGTSVTLVGKLRAFVKINEKAGGYVPGSLFLGKSKPATGRWLEINATFEGAVAPTTTTTTSSSTSTTTSTTTQGVNSIFIYFNDNNSGWLSYRNYDLDPNIYYIASPNGFRVYYLGSIGLGTQFFYNQALTQPVESYRALFLPQNQSYTAPANSIFYQLDSTGTITSELGSVSSVAWNQFGNNPSLLSGVETNLVPCNQFSLNGFALAPGITSIGVGVTVYNGLNNPFSYWNYLAYNGTVYVLNGGSVVLSEQACSSITTTTTTSTTIAPLNFTLSVMCDNPDPSVNPYILATNFTGGSTGLIYPSSLATTESAALNGSFNPFPKGQSDIYSYAQGGGYTVGQVYWVAVQDTGNPSNKLAKSITITSC
jgi:hypothetical protein